MDWTDDYENMTVQILNEAAPFTRGVITNINSPDGYWVRPLVTEERGCHMIRAANRGPHDVAVCIHPQDLAPTRLWLFWSR